MDKRASEAIVAGIDKINELRASHERLRAALISACHAAGIRGQAIPDPVHNVGELQWAPEAREALKQIPKGE